MKKQWALIVLAVILFEINSPSSIAAQNSGRAAPSGRARTPELGSVDQFKAEFKSDTGKVRLVALVSPT